MKRLPFATFLLCMIACKSADNRAPSRRGPAGSASETARKEPKLDLSAPRLGSLVPSASVDGKFGEHGGAFALQFGAAKAKLLTDGKVLVCDGPRLLRLTADGRPDASFGRRGAIGFPGTDLECINVLPIPGGNAYLLLGPSSPLASRRIMKMSSSGELVELVPDREVGTLATDGEGRLVELRNTKEHDIYMDTLAPAAASVKLDAERKDWILAFALVGERPLVWPWYFFGGEKPDHKLMRFIPSGEPDKTFATAGIFRLPNRCNAFEGVLGPRDGRLLVASKGCIAILDAKGRADTSFGQNGILELGSDGAPLELPDGRIVLTGHVDGTAARLVTLSPNGQRTDTTLLKGPVVSTRIAGVDVSGRVLVDIGVHHYVTEHTTDQETVMVMTRP